MVTLEEEVEKQEEEEDEQPTTNLSIPLEIVEAILPRLPVKSILRSTPVSKRWFSLISHPSFSKLQFTHATLAHRIAFFISAFDTSTHKRHYFSASCHGGPLTLLMTVDNDTRFLAASQRWITPSHLNGLVCFTSMSSDKLTPLFINPTTRKVFKLPVMIHPCFFEFFGHLYGFDESTNQHKILLINTMSSSEFMIFDMSTRSWRQIEAEPHVGFHWDDFQGYFDGGVCFDSKVHVMLEGGATMFDILVFDFVTEKFSLIRLPEDWDPDLEELGNLTISPFIVKISGYLGVVVNDYRRSEIHIWLLQDYENGVWVKETITLPEPWNALPREFPLSIDANMEDEIVFNITEVYENVMIVPVYNRKTKSFRSLEFTLDG